MGWSTVSSGLLDNLHTRIFLVYSHLSGDEGDWLHLTLKETSSDRLHVVCPGKSN
jgi:hypothetical protein